MSLNKNTIQFLLNCIVIVAVKKYSDPNLNRPFKSAKLFMIWFCSIAKFEALSNFDSTKFQLQKFWRFFLKKACLDLEHCIIDVYNDEEEVHFYLNGH